MKINVQKLDATIEKLQQLRRLATDPALSDFIEITGRKISTNGNGTQDSLDTSGHSALKDSVLAACRDLGGSFTIKEVYQLMEDRGTSSQGTEKSVSNMLRLLASNGELKIAVQGRGRRPTSYSMNIA